MSTLVSFNFEWNSWYINISVFFLTLVTWPLTKLPLEKRVTECEILEQPQLLKFRIDDGDSHNPIVYSLLELTNYLFFLFVNLFTIEFYFNCISTYPPHLLLLLLMCLYSVCISPTNNFWNIVRRMDPKVIIMTSILFKSYIYI